MLPQCLVHYVIKLRNVNNQLNVSTEKADIDMEETQITKQE